MAGGCPDARLGTISGGESNRIGSPANAVTIGGGSGNRILGPTGGSTIGGGVDITTVDADGVALAAIQGLNQKLEEELKAKDARLKTVEEELSALKRLVTKLAGAVEPSTTKAP